MEGFLRRVVCHVEHYKDDDQNDRNDDLESFLCSNLILILTAPLDVVARGHSDALSDDTLCLLHKSAASATSNIHEYGAPEKAVLAGDHRRTDGDPCVRDVLERYRRAIHGWHYYFAQSVDALSKIASVPHANGIPFAPFDCVCDV